MIFFFHFFGLLLKFSYWVAFNNYFFSLVIFTLITKIILLPISLWTQKNSIKMVEMKPKLNMIKAKFFGDKDKIADETAALYKTEKYNPFAGMIPMIIQILILLGIIQVVRHPEYAGLTATDMCAGNIDYSVYPSAAGGLYLIMPVLAGISALVLGLAQNHMNPLQSVQSRAGQISTNAVSIIISFALAAFVPVAVGFYWIFSNLSTILQQLLLNVIINPKKYIDEKALAESNKKLAEIEGIVSDKEFISREKADYKRFFSIVNKHIVFYSEKNGFYKYFAGIIDYLLEHSNLTIHYITSDPFDDIFKKAEENKRIRAYYIGEKRLITLMMKMDADIVVMTMTDLGNYHIKRSYVRKDVEYIYTFHHPLSTHLIYRKGSFDHYDTVLCTGNFQIKEIRAYERQNNLPQKHLIACGYGQLELLQKAYDGTREENNSCKQILIAPSWQPDNILDSCIDTLLSHLLGKEWKVIVRPHPQYMRQNKERMNEIISRYKDYTKEELVFETDFSSNSSLFKSDLVITDWSGAAYEFVFVTGKPVVFIDTPMKVYNPNWQDLGIEPQDIALRDKVGVRVKPDNLFEIERIIKQLLSEQKRYINNNIAIRDSLIANYGYSSEVAGKYIIQKLKEKAKHRRS